MSHARRSSLDVVLFCALAGTAATFAGGYTFAEFNQVEHLPMIFRIMDPGYLERDFYVNAVDAFNPRFYYAWLMATAGRWVPLPLLFALLTCAANAGIAAVTWHIARSMAPRREAVAEVRPAASPAELAAVLACCTVLAVNAFSEGGAAQIPRDFLGPSLLARPLAMLGLWWTLRGRAVAPLMLFVAAILLHPLVGAETAVIAVAAAGLVLLARLPEEADPWRLLGGHDMARLLGMGAAIVLAMWLLYGGGQQSSLPTDRFIRILAEARGPHHYIPSRFGTGSHLAFAAFCLAALLSWIEWGRLAPDRDIARGVLAVGIVVLLGCLCGYVFVELIPTRLATAAQTFRMTYLIKWFGLLLFAQVAARAIRAGRPPAERLSGALLALGSGRYQPAIALMGNVGLLAERRAGRWWRRTSVRAAVGAIRPDAEPGEPWVPYPTPRVAGRSVVTLALLAGVVISIVLVIVPITSRPEEPFLLALLLGLAAWVLFIEPAWKRRLVPAVVLGAAVALLVGFRGAPGVISAARVLGVHAPRMSLEESAKPWTGAAWFARAETPPDAVFIVPPRLGGFRLLARRAVVVDNKVFPFGDADMQEWYKRMLFTHAGRSDGDLPSLIELDANFAVVDDAHLQRVRQRYGATHALLWPLTDTAMPVLYEDAAFKIVRIEGR